MQKIQQLFIGVLVAFSAIGTGTLISHVGNLNIDKIKTEVTASTDAIAPAATPSEATPASAPSDTSTSAVAPPTTQTAVPESAPIPTPIDPTTIAQPIVPASDSQVTPISDTVLTPILPTDKNETSTSIKKTKKHIAKGETTPSTETTDSMLTDPSTPEPTTSSLNIASTPEDISVLPAAENTKSSITTEQSKTESNVQEEEKVQTPSTQVEEKVQTPSPEQEKDKATREAMKNQPKINKKILETLKGMAMIPDLLVKLGVIIDDSKNDGKFKIIYKKKEEEVKKPDTLLDIFTNLIKELTDNLQENTMALEETINYIYKQQGNDPALSGRCIQSTYFTYSDAENACMMISRKVCKTSEIVPDNRYETIELCKQDHGLGEKISESREVSAFKKQKAEYLGRLKTLQDAFKYYSVKWEELVDLANDSTDFDTLGQAGDAINLYRTEQGEGKMLNSPAQPTPAAPENSAGIGTTPDSTLPQTQPAVTAP